MSDSGDRARAGRGQISGTISTALGAMGVLAVACFLFPSVLTTPELRAVYDLRYLRALVQGGLVAAFGLGLFSLRKLNVLGAIGVGLSVVAVLMGGWTVQVATPVRKSDYIGLDWFLLELFFLGLVFIPTERLFRRIDQSVLRRGWRTDLAHFFMSHVLIEMIVLLTMLPATTLFRWAAHPGLARVIDAQPAVLQFFEALVVADTTTYFSHRLFHVVPWLWRFHAVHHSIERMDWLASSRIHLVDAIVTRAIAFVPIFVLGFAPEAVRAYLVFVSFHAILLHANVRLDLGPLRWIVAGPAFHHWHHAVEREALDKNFAIHLPVLDRIFGTAYMPKRRWPSAYGIEGSPVPERYGAHLVYPFAGGRR